MNALKADKPTIDRSTFHRYKDKCPDRYAAYIRAREQQGEALHDKIIDKLETMNLDDRLVADTYAKHMLVVAANLNQTLRNSTALIDQSKHIHLNSSEPKKDESANLLTIAAQQLRLKSHDSIDVEVVE